MAPGARLTVPYEPPLPPKKTNLAYDVQRIVKQKGPFHTVTEERLLKDLREPSRSDGAEEDLDEDDTTTTETVEATRDRLFRVRQEMLDGLGQVQNDLLTLIDSLSLAVSGSSRVAASAMSPALKQSAPLGSIETREVQPRKPLKKATVQKLQDVSVVARTQAFQRSTEQLLEASDRLKAETQKQAQYWEQMATLRSNGWPISRLPSNSRALVVHFSSIESSPQYRNKGVAILSQDEKGDLVLPGQSTANVRKVVLVTVHRNGVATGRYVPSYTRDEQKATWQIEKDLYRIRESLFQEELFLEASKEARLIANMGVRTRSSSIEIEISPDLIVEISHGTKQAARAASLQIDDALAKFVGCGLRVMLVAEHQQKHLQRTHHQPQPITPTPRPLAEYVLLRPLISQLRHQVALSPLLRIINTYQLSLHSAGMSFAFEHEEQQKVDDQLSLQGLRNVVSSKINLSLPSGEGVSIRVETHLAPPIYGTQFFEVAHKNECGVSKCPRTSRIEDVTNFLGDVLARDVGCTILLIKQNEVKWEFDVHHPLVLQYVQDQKCLAKLAISCNEGGIVVGFKSDQSIERARWSPQGMSGSQGAGAEDTASSSKLLDLVRSWTLQLYK